MPGKYASTCLTAFLYVLYVFSRIWGMIYVEEFTAKINHLNN